MTSQDGIYLSLKLQAPIVVGVDLGAVVERLRQSVRVIGRRTVQSARRNAPGKRLRHQIDHVETETELGLTTNIYMPTGLKYTLPPGTIAHTIPGGATVSKSAAAEMQKQKGYPLRFYWEKGPDGPGVYSFWSVEHPGYDPKEDWSDRVMEDTIIVADQEMEDLSNFVGSIWEEGVRVVT